MLSCSVINTCVGLYIYIYIYTWSLGVVAAQGNHNKNTGKCTSPLVVGENVQFFHLSFQEFLAAEHAWKLVDLSDLVD